MNEPKKIKDTTVVVNIIILDKIYLPKKEENRKKTSGIACVKQTFPRAYVNKSNNCLEKSFILSRIFNISSTYLTALMLDV